MRSPLFARIALGLFAVYLAVSVSYAAYDTVRNGRLVYVLRGETPVQERVRCYGPDYTEQIETIRRTIPRDGAYILLNGNPGEEGGPLWVKFDLAPRRAVYLGNVEDVGSAERMKRRMPRAARWVVIAYGPYRRPELIERYKFVQAREKKKGA